MYAQFKGSGKSTQAYIAKSFRMRSGDRTSTVIVEKLGSLESIAAAHPGVDPKEWARERARALTAMEKADRSTVTVRLDPGVRIRRGESRRLRGGVLPLMVPVYGYMGLGRICDDIKSRRHFGFDLSAIACTLVFGRVLDPDSKLATFGRSKDYPGRKDFRLESVYRALSVLAEESDFVQKEVYANTVGVSPRNTTVIYYDCTNYYFEIEEDDPDRIGKDGTPELGLRKYGHSKENRPNPIVQVGMFMDGDGMPLAFCVNPGNTPETQTIVPLEKKLDSDFNLSEFVCCTDGGLGSAAMREYNSAEGREYITVQSLKDRKCTEAVQEWALKDGEWNIPGVEGTHTIEEAARILGEKFGETTLYKDRWFKVGKEETDVHYVVTYSQKYADYQRSTREAQVARALKKIERGESTKPKSPNDCRRFIEEIAATEDGVAADVRTAVLNTDRIEREARFDGLYALATSLDDDAPSILRANGYRAEIEALFRITKSTLETRPVFLSRPDRIIAHLMVCYLALIAVKRLQGMLDEKGRHYSVEQIVDCLRGMDYLELEAHGYLPCFDRTAITEDIQGLTGYTLDSQIITKPTMRKMIGKLMS